MASVKYDKSISTDFTSCSSVFNQKLEREIAASAITKAFDYSGTSGDTVSIWFKEALSASDETELDAVVAAHDGVPDSETVEPVDSDGNKYAPFKIAPSGWTYMAYSFEVETSNVTGLYDDDHDGTDRGCVSAKYYKADDTECADQTDANSNCVKSAYDFMYPADTGLKGGFMNVLADPSSDIRMTVIGLPDYAGGVAAQTFINNVNLRYLLGSERLNIDGATIKILPYNAGIGTNLIRFIVNHDAGHKSKISIVLEFYHP